MSPVEQIVMKLQKYPWIKYEAKEKSIEVPEPNENGFSVSFSEDGKEYVVCLGPCHWHLEEMEEALDHFGFGLSKKCRLRELVRGRPYKWIIEQETDTGWAQVNLTGLLFFRFWKKREERIYQNCLIE
jgi:hypothetical protein